MNFDIASHWHTLFMNPRRLVEPPSWVPHIPFAFYFIEQVRPRVLVELGVHTGNSFSAFCQAVRHVQSSTTCYGVDTFQGDEHAGHYDQATYDDLRSHIQNDYPDFAQLMRMTFDEAAAYFSEGSIDALHIDGLHTYEAVRHDFDTWLPKLSERGVVLLHDVCVRQKDFGVWKLWEEVEEHYPSFCFRHGHGLGLLAVGKEAPPSILDFIAAAPQNETIPDFFFQAGERLAKDIQLQELPTLRHLCAVSAQRVSELEPHLAYVQEQIAQREQRIGELEEKIGELEERIGELDQENNKLQTEKKQILASWSWRLSRPLRRIGALLQAR